MCFSGVCASGSLSGVMSGKHFNRLMRVHRISLEALERLLILEFIKKHPLTDEAQFHMLRIAKDPSCQNLTSSFGITSVKDVLTLYNTFKEDVRLGLLGKTG